MNHNILTSHIKEHRDTQRHCSVKQKNIIHENQKQTQQTKHAYKTAQTQNTNKTKLNTQQ
jgi:hypothetical protein